MAGSRREYLAGDKPKIYIAVKLLSVINASRGSDPDERAEFFDDRTVSIFASRSPGCYAVAIFSWCGHVFYEFK